MIARCKLPRWVTLYLLTSWQHAVLCTGKPGHLGVTEVLCNSKPHLDARCPWCKGVV